MLPHDAVTVAGYNYHNALLFAVRIWASVHEPCREREDGDSEYHHDQSTNHLFFLKTKYVLRCQLRVAGG